MINPVVVQKITSLMNNGDRDTAMVLWTRACEMASCDWQKRQNATKFYLYYFLFGVTTALMLVRLYI